MFSTNKNNNELLCVQDRHGLKYRSMMKTIFSHWSNKYQQTSLLPRPPSQNNQRSCTSNHNSIFAMKRSIQFLQRPLDALLARPISLSDRSGYLYNFFETNNEVKVGRSIDPARRQLQWDAECPNPYRVWDKPIWCPYANRAGRLPLNLISFHSPAIESIAHILLELHCLDRPRYRCSTCRWILIPLSFFYSCIPGNKQHREIFTFHGRREVISRRVRRVLCRARWM